MHAAKSKVRLIALSSLAWLIIATGLSRAADDSAREQEVFRLGVEAYIYGYPLVLMDANRRQKTNVAAPMGVRAPINQFAHLTFLPTAETKAVVSPNVDTLLSLAWLDLSSEPAVLHVPDTDGRYYLMALFDAWTNVFASLGKRTTGTKERNFAIVGPHWNGELPEGVKQIKAPTSIVWITARTQVNGIFDTIAVKAIQKQFTITPLSSWGKSGAPGPKVSVDPNLDMKTPPAKQVADMDMATFFEKLTALMMDNPPAPADQKTIASFKAIGIVPDKPFDVGQLDAASKNGMERAVKLAMKRIQQPPANAYGKPENGWLVNRTGLGRYGTDYRRRAFMAFAALGANLPQDVIYPITNSDGKGKRLSGSHPYVIHFPKGQTPPVNGFWSLTMYGTNNFFVANAINRYAIGSRNELNVNEDGSLDIYIQHDSPGRKKQANWLPAPSGNFNLTLWLYWPKKEMLDGTWKVPPVERAE